MGLLKFAKDIDQLEKFKGNEEAYPAAPNAFLKGIQVNQALAISVDLNDIMRLAKDSNQSARDQLLEQLVDFYCHQVVKPLKSEQILFADLIVLLLKRAGQKSRAKVCQQLASSNNTPKNLARVLAFSRHPELYDPFLRQSKALSIEALKKASLKLTDAHRLAMASREKLTPPLSATLIEQGSNEVARRLTDNDGALFFNRSVSHLLRRSNQDTHLQQCVENRLRRLGLFLNQLKKVLKAELGLNESDFELSDFASYVHAFDQKAAATPGLPTDICLSAGRHLEGGAVDLSDLLSNLIDLERDDDIIRLISEHLRIPLKRARQAFCRPDPDEFATMCYALHIDRLTFKKAAKFRLIAQGLDVSQTTISVQSFRRVTKKGATHFVSALQQA